MQLSPCLKCARLWFLLPCGDVFTGGSWWQLLHLAPWYSSWVLICFMNCHLCESSGLVYSLSLQAHEREAAAGTGCIHLCLHHAVFGTGPAVRKAVGTASSLLQTRFPLQPVDQREDFFPDKNLSCPAVSISAPPGKTSLTASLWYPRVELLTSFSCFVS